MIQLAMGVSLLLHDSSQVLLGLLGVEVLQLQGDDPSAAPQSGPSTRPECQGVPEQHCKRRGEVLETSLFVGEPYLKTVIKLEGPGYQLGDPLIDAGDAPLMLFYVSFIINAYFPIINALACNYHTRKIWIRSLHTSVRTNYIEIS